MFTTPCFIRKNTPELRKKLEELGYIISDTLVITNFNEIICYDNIAYGCEYPCEYRQKAIDCGVNEELFLALIALRDDTDKNQWVIDEANECFGWENSWSICDKDDMNEKVVYTHYRKATVEELIEHFK